MSNLPKYEPELGFEDTSNINNDIQELFNKYISPIENFRSHGIPSYVAKLILSGHLIADANNTVRNGIENDEKPTESRAHAFYRMIGLPVVANDGSLFNPGFLPPDNRDDDSRISISSKISNEYRDLMDKREDQAKVMRDILSSGGMKSTLATAVTLFPKPFNTIDDDNKKQVFKVDGRSEFVSLLKKDNVSLSDGMTSAAEKLANTPVTAAVDSGQHILIPFITDPLIHYTVLPGKNQLCAPFLPSKESTKMDANAMTGLYRPGIEFIVRNRLLDVSEDKVFLDFVRKTMKREKSPNLKYPDDTSISDLHAAIEALAGVNDIKSADVDKIFAGFTTTQATIVTQLVNTIKVVVKILIDSILEFHEIMEQINWLPSPSSTFAIQYGNPGKTVETTSTTKLEKSLLLLKINKENSQSDQTIEQELGNFATPFTDLVGSSTVYDKRINELAPIKDSITSKSMELLQTIEIITGEFSGLGLIDILAVYTALWSISIEDLLNFLDEGSVVRLYNNFPKLRTKEVENRSNGFSDILNTLPKFESKVRSILAFADALVQKELGDPKKQKGNPAG